MGMRMVTAGITKLSCILVREDSFGFGMFPSWQRVYSVCIGKENRRFILGLLEKIIPNRQTLLETVAFRIVMQLTEFMQTTIDLGICITTRENALPLQLGIDK